MATRKKAAKKTKKAAPKKVAKKTATKKGVKKAAPKKVAAKKKAVAKKTIPVKKKASANTRKPAARAKKTLIRPKKIVSKASKAASFETKGKKATKAKAVENIVETNLPPVEEKSPEVQAFQTMAPVVDIKSMQKVAVRNYDNHHLRLSNLRKGGIKPSGKKPLW
ncbi:MAG: hypothetical protein SGI83_08055 [Bacteroidota bacterium]|nr:hypothetical protein [Bacteroidota bacterium]